MKNYMVYFKVYDHSSDIAACEERTIVPAESSEHAIKQFVVDMVGSSYEIIEVVELSY